MDGLLFNVKNSNILAFKRKQNRTKHEIYVFI